MSHKININPAETENSSNTPQPRVSCLMVTADRKQLAHRAVRCFINQSYPNKELVVIDDGEEDYASLFVDIPADDILYIKIDRQPNKVLGSLRNLSLEKARGEYLMQWDDDDWYHPDRIARQVWYLQQGYDACCLSASLMHLDHPDLFDLPYIGYLPDGIPGSIMHKRSDTIRYPEVRRAEDTDFLKQWMQHRYIKMPARDAGMFIRCFHGTNTWEVRHFTRRFRNSPSTWLQYFYYRYIKMNLADHPRFRLSEENRAAFRRYIEESRHLEIFPETGKPDSSPNRPLS